MEKVTELTARLAEPVIAEQGCTLWDVEYVKEAGTWYLRVLIDKEGGVDILDCEAISRKLSDLLDEADPIEGSYTLEVGSARCGAGAEAPCRFSALSEQPRAGEALQAGGRTQGVPRYADPLIMRRTVPSPWRWAAKPIPLTKGPWRCAACGWNFKICDSCLGKRRIKKDV